MGMGMGIKWWNKSWFGSAAASSSSSSGRSSSSSTSAADTNHQGKVVDGGGGGGDDDIATRNSSRNQKSNKRQKKRHDKEAGGADDDRGGGGGSSTSSSSSNNNRRKQKATLRDYLLLDNRVRLGYVALLCIFLGLILPSIISYYLGEYQADLGNCNPPSRYKLECLSGSAVNVTASTCEAAGCCYDPNSTPRCFHRNPTRYTYVVTNVLEDTSRKIRVDLTPERRSKDAYGNDLLNARVVVRAVNPHHLIVQLLCAGQSEEASFRLLTVDEQTPFEQTDFDVQVSLTLKRSFGLTIKRKSTGVVLLDTTRGPLSINGSHVVEMTTTVPSEFVYGLGTGERRTSFQRNFNYGKTALFNRVGSDGFHPFYMAVEPDPNNPKGGLVHGVFWDNPNPLEVQFNPAPSISFRAMGGSGVFHILSGPSPQAVSKQLATEIIGLPVMPPFWSLGLHLCRENDNATVFQQTMEQMIKYGIGFDSDCIDGRLSGPGMGAIDTTKFPTADDDRRSLRVNDIKFLLSQPPHSIEQNVNGGDFQLVQCSQDTNDFLSGKRFNTSVFYPSYAAIDSEGGPVLQLDASVLLDPDGLSLVDNWPLDDASSSSSCSATDRPRPFIPDRLRTGNIITVGTLCMDAFHPNLGLDHVAVHNHYGIQQLSALSSGNPDIERRMLYLNRATALGNLGLAGYSGDDFSANWLSMRMALVQVMEMGLFGVPLSGAPICGSTDATLVDNLQSLNDEELCTRWFQLGLLLPFAQSTSRLKQWLRSPVDWSPTLRRIVVNYVEERYRLLPYYYTLLHQASVEGTPIVRPMFYDFLNDNQTYSLSEQFMLGDSIMVCPALSQDSGGDGITPVNAYFPNGTWYDYYTGDRLIESVDNSTTVMTGIYHINMFVRNGTVFVTQEAGKSAEETRKSAYTVTAAGPFTPPSGAQGQLYVDDGYTTDPNAHDLIQFRFTADTFTMEIIRRGFDSGSNKGAVSTLVDSIRILGVNLQPNQVPADGAMYEPQTRVLRMTNLGFDWSIQPTYTVQFIKTIN